MNDDELGDLIPAPPDTPGAQNPAPATDTAMAPSPLAPMSDAENPDVEPMSSVPSGSGPDLIESAPNLSTVSGQLQELFSEGNPLMQQAEEGAVRYAASRGLQNSTMAAQAGRQAYYQAALPIAQQDASHFSGLEQIEAQGDIQSQLQMEQFEYNTQLSSQQHVQQLTEIAAQGDVQLLLQDNQYQNSLGLLAEELSNNLAISELDQTEFMAGLELQHQNALEEIAVRVDTDTAAQLQGQYLAGVAQRQLQASAEIQTIYQTQGLSSYQQQEAVRVAQQRLQSDLTLLGQYYAAAPSWNMDWGINAQNPGSGAPSNTGGTPAPAPAGPSPTPPPGPGPSPITTPSNPIAPDGTYLGPGGSPYGPGGGIQP